MAFGGMMTAVAVVIMSLGSLIPVNTYVCPVMCILITRPVMERCGRRLAWCYYMATAVLSMMLATESEPFSADLFLLVWLMHEANVKPINDIIIGSIDFIRE